MDATQSLSTKATTASPSVDALVDQFSHEYMQGISTSDVREVSALLPLLDQEKLRGASAARPLSSDAAATLRAETSQRTPTPAWTTAARALVVVALICLLLYYLYTREEGDAQERRGNAEANSGSGGDDIGLLANWSIDEGDAVDGGLPHANGSRSTSASDAGQEIGQEGDAASRVDDGVVDPLFQPL